MKKLILLVLIIVLSGCTDIDEIMDDSLTLIDNAEFAELEDNYIIIQGEENGKLAELEEAILLKLEEEINQLAENSEFELIESYYLDFYADLSYAESRFLNEVNTKYQDLKMEMLTTLKQELTYDLSLGLTESVLKEIDEIESIELFEPGVLSSVKVVAVEYDEYFQMLQLIETGELVDAFEKAEDIEYDLIEGFDDSLIREEDVIEKMGMKLSTLMIQNHSMSDFEDIRELFDLYMMNSDNNLLFDYLEQMMLLAYNNENYYAAEAILFDFAYDYLPEEDFYWLDDVYFSMEVDVAYDFDSYDDILNTNMNVMSSSRFVHSDQLDTDLGEDIDYIVGFVDENDEFVFGAIYYEYAVTYTGDIKNNLPNGYGMYIDWLDLFYYDGQMINDKFNGYGMIVYDGGDEDILTIDGDYYIGEFDTDMFSGQGIYYYSDGGYHVGNFWMNEPYGAGVMHWSNGDYFDAEWTDWLNGIGTYYWSDGEVKESTLENGVWTE